MGDTFIYRILKTEDMVYGGVRKVGLLAIWPQKENVVVKLDHYQLISVWKKLVGTGNISIIHGKMLKKG